MAGRQPRLFDITQDSTSRGGKQRMSTTSVGDTQLHHHHHRLTHSVRHSIHGVSYVHAGVSCQLVSSIPVQVSSDTSRDMCVRAGLCLPSESRFGARHRRNGEGRRHMRSGLCRRCSSSRHRHRCCSRLSPRQGGPSPLDVLLQELDLQLHMHHLCFAWCRKLVICLNHRIQQER